MIPAKMPSLSAAALLMLFFQGCLDPSPGDGMPASVRAVRSGSCGPEGAYLLVLDEEAINNGCSFNRFSRRDVNDGIAAVGLRADLPWFAAHAGREIVLPSGQVGDEGWFAVPTVPEAWRKAGPDRSDGLRNYLEAGPGLGSPDARGSRESLLCRVRGVTPLRATGLARLAGETICAVVMDDDVRMGYSPLSGSLNGRNLGKVAFQVLSVVPSSSSRHSSSRLPGVKIRILDAESVCGDMLRPFLDAPVPVSSCKPMDVDPPACTIRKSLLVEPWDGFDTAKWRGDGEERVADGYFSAMEGAKSAFADWINPCPVKVESTTAIRFRNRIRFSASGPSGDNRGGALFLVSADTGGAYRDYLFIGLGYTRDPGRVFVELFGESGGEPFDQFMRTSLEYGPVLDFDLELSILSRGYRVSIGGQPVDSVALGTPLPAIGLFEVGVQEKTGLRGLIDETSITRDCPKEGNQPPAAKGAGLTWVRGEADACARNSLVLMAREKIRTLANPPVGLVILSRMPLAPGCE